MKAKYLSNADFNFEKVNRASVACGPMVKWAIAQVRNTHNSLARLVSKWVWSGSTTITYCRQTHGIMRKSHRTIMRHQEDKQNKATSSLFPIEMIVKVEWTQSNAQQNIEQLQNPTMGETINMNQQQQNHRPRTDSSQRLKCIVPAPNPALDSAVVEVQKMLSSHWGFLTIAVYPHRETI